MQPFISKAQPFVDIVALNTQNFFSNYKDSSQSPVYIQDNFLNLFIPKKFGKGHVFLLRFNSEQLTINRAGQPTGIFQLYSFSIPIGLQLVSKNQKWKYTGIIIPKINSDLRDDVKNDFQLGGIGLVARVFNENLQVKFGLYYNREFFGNFFMPLAGVDWKINSRFQMYGTLPSNFRMEFKLSQKWNTGLGFRSFTRSFRLSENYNNDFIWVRENQAKVYVEGFILKNVIATFDVYRSIGYRLPRNDFYNHGIEKITNPIFANFNDNFGFTIGFAYRILTKKDPDK
ncbi:MAG: DUF6268 family outer membrane beta-barrel protein [Bacteroidota bacterium]